MSGASQYLKGARLMMVSPLVWLKNLYFPDKAGKEGGRDQIILIVYDHFCDQATKFLGRF